jgi:hypothetical protein
MSAGTPWPAWYVSRTRWPGPLGAIMLTSTSGGGVIVSKRMLNPCANISVLPGAEVRRDLVLVDLRLRRVGHEHHDDVGPRRRLGHRQ